MTADEIRTRTLKDEERGMDNDHDAAASATFEPLQMTTEELVKTMEEMAANPRHGIYARRVLRQAATTVRKLEQVRRHRDELLDRACRIPLLDAPGARASASPSPTVGEAMAQAARTIHDPTESLAEGLGKLRKEWVRMANSEAPSASADTPEPPRLGALLARAFVVRGEDDQAGANPGDLPTEAAGSIEGLIAALGPHTKLTLAIERGE